MSSVVKKNFADKSAFKYSPKSIHTETSKVAKEFVSLQTEVPSDFQIANIVSEQSGVRALQKQNIDAQVEDTVLHRLKEVEEKAYAQAYDLGLIEGAEKAFQEKNLLLDEKLNDLSSALTQLSEHKKEFEKESEAILIHLIFQIAKKIALREISLQQDPIIEMLNQLVEEVQVDETITVRLHPEDLSFVEEMKSKKNKNVEPLEKIKLVGDPTFTKGGCVLETNYGSIVNTVEQRVNKAWDLLSNKIPNTKVAGS